MTTRPVSTPPSHGPSVDPMVDDMLLPPVRRRLRELLTFLSIFQGSYVLAMVLTPDAVWGTRLLLNVGRLVVMILCILRLRADGSRRDTLLLATASLGSQFLVGTAASIARGDVVPTALLLTALNCISAALIPWGFAPQVVTALASVTSIAIATHFVKAAGGATLAFDSSVTLLASIAFCTWVARYLAASRRTLEIRLAEARRSDEELAALRTDLERRVAERTAELEMANRELEGFSYTVSHDLRSPLRTIAGFSQMILDESGQRLDDSARDHLSKIRAASRRMDELIDDMLLLARVGRTALRYETVDVAKMAASIGAQLAAEEPQRKVEFVVGNIPPVPADHGLLQVALDNLLRNAWKFTGEREAARVAVSGELRDGRVVIRVEDNGVGFDPRFRHKLFLPFQRLHDFEVFPGTGVGLATVARIVRRHGGEVDADGREDGGATITIALPATRPA